MNVHDRARAGMRRLARLIAAGVAAGTAGLALVPGQAALAAPAPPTPVGCSAGALAAAVSGAQNGAVLSLAPRCTYVVEDNSLDIGVSLTIQGNGDTITAGTPGMDVISVLAPGPVSLDGLTVTGGAAALENFFDEGTLTVTGSTFTGNDGAVYSYGTMTVTGSTFTGNSGPGGAIVSYGTLTVAGSTFTGNTSAITTVNGIFNEGMTVTGSTFTGNSGPGGAIDNGATLSVTGSTFTRNTSLGRGGAIGNDGMLTVSDSTFWGNTAAKDGGAISNDGTATLANDVITGNEASAYGGGLDNDGTATLANVVIAKNKAHADGGGIRNRGSVTLTRTQVKSNRPDNCAPTGTITGCAG